MTTQEPLYLKSEELWAVCNVLYDLLKRRLSTKTKGLYAKEKALEVSGPLPSPEAYSKTQGESPRGLEWAGESENGMGVRLLNLESGEDPQRQTPASDRTRTVCNPRNDRKGGN